MVTPHSVMDRKVIVVAGATGKLDESILGEPTVGD